MGTLCPVCQTHQPFAAHLTKDQGPAIRATDVIGHKLGCGHMVGGTKFNKFQEVVREIEARAAKQIQDIQEQKTEQLGAAWAVINSNPDRKGGK